MWEYRYTDELYHSYDELYHYGVPGMKWGRRKLKQAMTYDRKANKQQMKADAYTQKANKLQAKGRVNKASKYADKAKIRAYNADSYRQQSQNLNKAIEMKRESQKLARDAADAGRQEAARAIERMKKRQK